jgi:hypothetical protein
MSQNPQQTIELLLVQLKQLEAEILLLRKQLLEERYKELNSEDDQNRRTARR